MNDFDASPANTRNDVESAKRVADDLACAKCGYNLRSLLWDAKCPECGTAVRLALPPCGFRFPTWRALKRARLGLACLVLWPLLAVLFQIALTAAMRWYYMLPPQSLLPVVRTYFYSSPLALLAATLGVFLVASAGRHGKTRLPKRLGIAAGVLAVIGLLAHIACLITAPGTYLPLGKPMLLPWLLQLCTPLSIVLLWVCLLWLVERRAERRLFWGLALSLPAALTVLFVGTMSVLGTTSYSIFQLGWHSDWDFFTDILPRYLMPASWLVMLLVLWMFYRRLSAALRFEPAQNIEGNSQDV